MGVKQRFADADHPGGEYFRERTARTRRDFTVGFRRMHEAGLLAPGVDPEDAAGRRAAIDARPPR